MKVSFFRRVFTSDNIMIHTRICHSYGALPPMNSKVYLSNEEEYFIVTDMETVLFGETHEIRVYLQMLKENQ
jgi:hypothetical protein